VKYTYRFELDLDGEWYCPSGMEDTQLGFLRGYMLGRSDTPAPRRGMRIVRSDGKVMDEYAATTGLDIGLVAGWPTPEQYEEAAKVALERAERIREMNEARDKRRRT
jgi:hypothetical protein